MTDAPTLIGRLDPEQIRAAKAAAVAQDLAKIERRHAQVEAANGTWVAPSDAHADRGWLLQQLREARPRPVTDAAPALGVAVLALYFERGKLADAAVARRVADPDARWATPRGDEVRCPDLWLPLPACAPRPGER